MTVASLKAHLEINRPPMIQSCYELAGRYRVAEDTARSALQANGYVFDPDTSNWVRQETQLDRIERMLTSIHTALNLPYTITIPFNDDETE